MQMINFKIKINRRLGKIIQNSVSFKNKVKLDDQRQDASFDMVFFCGQNGIDLLNACLYSVYKTWEVLPNLIIVSDGTPIELIKSKLILWPKRVQFLIWQDCAKYYQDIGQNKLFSYASNHTWGKKLISILYLSRKNKILYSDTDVLWFKDPSSILNNLNPPFLKLMQEANEACYDKELVQFLQEDYVLSQPALNSGVIYAYGDFSTYAKWDSLFDYIIRNPERWTGWTEQTVLALLSNSFKTIPFKKEEVMLEVNDINELYPKLHKNKYSSIMARHYVTTKHWLFWRDYLTFFNKKSFLIFNNANSLVSSPSNSK